MPSHSHITGWRHNWSCRNEDTLERQWSQPAWWTGMVDPKKGKLPWQSHAGSREWRDSTQFLLVRPPYTVRLKPNRSVVGRAIPSWGLLTCPHPGPAARKMDWAGGSCWVFLSLFPMLPHGINVFVKLALSNVVY